MDSREKKARRKIFGVSEAESENLSSRARERRARIAVCDAVRACTEANGWAQLTRVGEALRELGVDYKGENGERKLVDYLRSPFLKGALEISSSAPNATGASVFYVRCAPSVRGKLRPLRGIVSGEYVLTAADVRLLAEAPEEFVTQRARDFLSDNFVRFDEETQDRMAADVHRLVRAEQWCFGRKNHSKFYPILSEYLLHTIFYLADGGNAAQGDRFLVFNTGLRSKIDAPIFLILQKNESRERGEPPWIYSAKFSRSRESVVHNPHGGFCMLGDEIAEIVEADILEWPEPADFGNTLAETFPPDAAPGEIIPEIDWKHWRHIIVENAVRIPERVLSEFPPAGFPPPPPGAQFSPEQAKTRRRRLSAAIAADKECFAYIRGRIEASIRAVVEEVKIGAVKIAPAYYPLKKRLSWLFPLSFGGSESAPELALVTEREIGENGKPRYIARTVFPLAWAYRSARVIGRPDCGWLDDPAEIAAWHE